MQSLPFLTVLSYAVLSVFAEETLVQMDKSSAESQCGKVFVLGPAQDVRLASGGQAPDGYCGISLFTPRSTENFTCDSICVTFKTASVSTCEVKVKFIGHKFRKQGDLQKTYDCHNKDRSPFCWDVSSMRVEVIESHSYAYVWDHKPQYGFDIDVYARCTKDPVPIPSRHSSLDEDKVRQTYVEGLVVGLCLASVFLIILFITYCYYKHKATNQRPSQTGSPSKRGKKPKPSFITTFRAKLLSRRNHSEDDPNQGAVYRKTGSTASTVVATKGTPEDPETVSELSPLTAEANEGKQTEFDECKLVISSETDEDLKKLKSEMDKTKEAKTDETKQEAEVKCETPDVIVHSGTDESADEKSDSKEKNGVAESGDAGTEHAKESENAVCFNS